MSTGLLIQPDSTRSPVRPSLFQRVAAGLYDQFTARLEQEALGAHGRRVPQQAHGHVLDVGAGTRPTSRAIRLLSSASSCLTLNPGVPARAAERAAASHVSASVHLAHQHSQLDPEHRTDLSPPNVRADRACA